MKEYHKIQTVFKRDPETRYKTLLIGEYSMPEFEYLRNNDWVFTEKVDGTNIRVMMNDGVISFGGKTDRAQIPADLINRLQTMFPPYGRMQETFDCDVCLYGEGYGAKIQKGGGNYRDDQGFVLFDVKIGDYFLQREDVEDIASKLRIDVVPVIGLGSLDEMVEMTRKGFDSLWGNFTAEGIVARPQTELKTRDGKRIITKIKHKDFR